MAVVGSRAYRDAPLAVTAPSLRLTPRGRRALHVFAIGAAAALCALALAGRITVPRVLLSGAVVTYGAGFGYATYGVSRGRTLIAVPLVAAAIALLLAASFWDIDHPLWAPAAWWAMSATIMVGLPASYIGWTIGAPLRRVRFIEPTAAPIVRRVAPRPVPRRVVGEDQPTPQREEPSLDSLPDSTRPLIFAVRLRRRMFERMRSPR